MKLALVIVCFFMCFTSEVHAKKKKSRIVNVQTDGAAVYKVPNFDSPIIAYLNKGRKIRASTKKYPGIGGLGVFYKVRLKKKKYGYVTDVDLFPGGQKKQAEETSGDIFTPTGMEGDPSLVPVVRGSGIAQKRYLGFSYNMVNYSETIGKKSYTENLTYYGLKMSGPRALFIDVPLELNIMGFFGAPVFYTKLFEKAEGFKLLADILYIYPLFQRDKYMLYVGLGPSLRYSSQQVEVKKLSNGNNIPFDTQFINLGGSVSAGLAFKLGQTFSVKVEGKYMHDEDSHVVYGGALQLAY